MSKIHIKKGDNVKVIAGDSKGKTGKVLEVVVDDYRAIVENANLASKHTKPNAKNPKGGIVKQEMAIHISNLMVVDSTGKATRIGRKVDEKTKKTVRVSKKSGEVIK
jgi:large subunit ribosomal protein L24